jgi:amidase
MAGGLVGTAGDARAAEEPPPRPVGQSADDLAFASGRDLARWIRAGELSAEELMRETLARIDRVNPSVNAIVTLRSESELMEEARLRDRTMSAGEPVGALHGIPIAVKDLASTKGIRTTQGSPIYADVVPDEDAIFVERFRRAGAIVIGKTNTPEFGAGSHTFNEVFGATLNPYDLSKSCGGSSGGAALAIATGMTAFADGSDLGGSLRNPGSFNNVVGFRPSPGRVPRASAQPWNPLAVSGPMARSVGDVAYLLSVMAGPDPRDPIALDEPGSTFLAPLGRSFRGVRVAWSENLGRYPVHPDVTAVCNSARPVFQELGMEVVDGEPDFSDADWAFQTLRGWMYAESYRDVIAEYRDQMKDTVIWNIERGLDLTAQDIARAERLRAALYRRVLDFMGEHHFLILPVSQVPPFPVTWDWVHEIEGVVMETYIDWMATCYAITLTGLPAISVPAGFTDDGLPVGLQIVGRHHHDLEVLQLAHAFERATLVGEQRPEIAVG